MGAGAIVTEAQLKAAAVAPRVTLEQLEAFIESESYFTALEGTVGRAHVRVERGEGDLPHQLGLLTICVLVLTNGFTVLGQSACASPANFDPEIGERLARQDATKQIWALLGFELRSKLAMVDKASLPSNGERATYIGTKVVHAQPMNRGAYNDFRGWTLPENEDPSDEGYLVEYAHDGKPMTEGYLSWSPKGVFDRAYELVRPAGQAQA